MKLSKNHYMILAAIAAIAIIYFAFFYKKKGLSAPPLNKGTVASGSGTSTPGASDYSGYNVVPGVKAWEMVK